MLGAFSVNMDWIGAIPVDTERKLNVYKTFRRRPGRLLSVLCTFNLRSVPERKLNVHVVTYILTSSSLIMLQL